MSEKRTLRMVRKILKMRDDGMTWREIRAELNFPAGRFMRSRAVLTLLTWVTV